MSKKKNKLKAPTPNRSEVSLDWNVLASNLVFALLCVGSFVAGLFALDRSATALVKPFHRQTLVDEQAGGSINQALHARAEAYVFGNSRAKHHYDCEILSQTTGLRFFNAGAEGQDVLYTRLLADLIEKEQQPKLYLVNVNLTDLMQIGYRYLRIDVFAPYIDDSAVVSGTLLHPSRGHEYRLRYGMLHTPRFNNCIVPILRQRLGHLETEGRFGYVPLHKPFKDDTPEHKWVLLVEQYDPFALSEFIHFLRQAKAKHIKVVLCMGPHYRYRSEFNLRKDEWFFLFGLRQIAQLMELPYIELSEAGYSEFRDSRYYQDVDHLNEAGARFFSEKLAQHLRYALSLPTLEGSMYKPPIEPRQYTIPMEYFESGLTTGL